MGWFDDFLYGVTGSDITGSRQRDFNNKLTREQFEYQKYWDANQTQIRAADYEKAGLNPMLATGTTPSSVGVTSPEQSHNSMGVLFNLVPSVMDSISKNKTIDTEKQIADDKLAEEKRQFNAQIQEQSEQFYANLLQEKEEAEKNRSTSIANTQFIARSNEAINNVTVEMQKEVRKEEMSYENMNKSLDRALSQYLKSIDVKQNELNREMQKKIEEEKNKVLRSNANKALTGNIISSFLHSAAVVLTGGLGSLFLPSKNP